jgi:cytochrome c biogenesis protein
MGFKEIWSKFYKTLSSVRTGIILLLIVVVFSAVGTVVLQRPTTEPSEIQRAYSPATLMWLDRFGLTDVYHASWFAILLGLVSLSIIFASLERWPTAWRFYARPNRRPEVHFRAALPYHQEFKINDAKAGMDAAERALIKLGLRPERVVENNEVSLYSERNRFSVLAVYIVHLSLLMIFAGGIVDAMFGYRGSLMLTTGETSNTIMVRQKGMELKKSLPFSIRCDAAGQENYADGSPKRWWSDLVVVDKGREIARKQIVVNDPLTYDGIRFYQSSFGASSKIDRLQLRATPLMGGEAQTITLAPQQAVQLGAENTIRMNRFVPDYYIQDGEVHQRSDEISNPAIELTLTSNGSSHSVWLFPRESNGVQDANVGYAFVLTDLKPKFYTGLEVSHEPGQWCVWGGVLLMALGLGVAFYLVHMRLWVTTLFDARQGLLLWAGGSCNKNRDRFEQRFAEVTEAIGKELNGNSKVTEIKKQDEPAEKETLAHR